MLADIAAETDERYFSAERTKAFVDAVVAIALTLLVLPLMESVAEAVGEGLDTREWLDDHAAQIFCFLLSFAIIALFWMNHHRQFISVKKMSTPLMWLLSAWMLTIVWLPVATALTGQMKTDDTAAKVQYVGTLIVTSLLSLAMGVYLKRHPALHTADADRLRVSLSVSLALTVLYLVALVIMILVPGSGYFPLFVLMLTGPAQTLFARVLR